MARKYFGTDGIRGRANGVITPELALKVGQAAGLDVQARRAPPPRAYRQGHPALRLHDRDRAGRRLHLGWHGRAADRPDADAGGRHAHALHARRSRRDDLGLAQPLRRQRHQAVRSGRLQAQRRHRAQDRSADGRRPHQEARQERRPRPRQAHRGRARPLHRIRQAHAAAHHGSRGPARGRRLRQRRRLPRGAGSAVGARRRGGLDRRRARRLQHQPRLRLDLARGALPQGARAARRYRHRARRRRRPRDHRRRAWAISSTATSCWP